MARSSNGLGDSIEEAEDHQLLEHVPSAKAEVVVVWQRVARAKYKSLWLMINSGVPSRGQRSWRENFGGKMVPAWRDLARAKSWACWQQSQGRLLSRGFPAINVPWRAQSSTQLLTWLENTSPAARATGKIPSQLPSSLHCLRLQGKGQPRLFSLQST